MQINISERLKPFSHLPGTFCLIPATTLRAQLYPAMILIDDLSHANPVRLLEIPVPVLGPLTEFTVQQDLEKCCLHIWGRDQQGYFCYQLSAGSNPQTIALHIEKGLPNWQPHLSQTSTQPSQLCDRLSLGNHKSQDWELVQRRADLTEILPVWIKLGQLVESPQNNSYEGTASLFKICQDSSKEDIHSHLKNLFLAAFEGLLSPRLHDSDHQGFNLPPVTSDISPLFLLTEGARIIRSLFVEVSCTTIHVLPKLPVEFHCGRFLHVRCADFGRLDLEWTKKAIRRCIFHAEQDQELNFQFPKEISQFRMNGAKQPVGQPIHVKKNQHYIFDNFQK